MHPARHLTRATATGVGRRILPSLHLLWMPTSVCSPLQVIIGVMMTTILFGKALWRQAVHLSRLQDEPVWFDFLRQVWYTFNSRTK
jgi:hypothetical protein